MNSKSKFFISITLICVLLSLAFVNVFAATPEDSISIYADEISSTAGKTVTVPLKIKNNTGLSAIGLKVSYDRDKLTPISVSKGSVFNSGMTDNNIGVTQDSCFNILWYNTKDVKTDGAIFEIEFLVKNNTSGKTELNIEVDEENTFDSNYDFPLITTETVVINISGNGSVSTEPTTVPSEPSESMLVYSEQVFGSSDKTANIPIYVKNNQGMMGFKFNFVYDSNVFTVNEVTQGEIINNGSLYYNNKAGNLTVLWNNSSEITDDGVIFYINVTYNKTAKADIAINYSTEDTFDENYNNIDIECSNISVNIFLSGDVDMNGVLDIVDATAIQKYLAGFITLDKNSLIFADYDENAVVSVLDATGIQKEIAEIKE